MRYSFNQEREGLVFAQRYDVNASPKDLEAVCDAVRYLKASAALEALDRLIAMDMPIPYRRHAKHRGARHELGGRKGGYPVKAAREVKLTIINAVGNADNRGLDGPEMVVVHSAANKTRIERRQPSRGSISWGRGMYGRGAMNHSDIEYAKIEIALANGDEKGVTERMKQMIRMREREGAARYKPAAPAPAKAKAGARQHQAGAAAKALPGPEGKGDAAAKKAQEPAAKAVKKEEERKAKDGEAGKEDAAEAAGKA